MKTNTLKKKVLQTLLVTAGICFINIVSACSATFTYSLGVNGHVKFTYSYSVDTATTRFLWNPGDGSPASTITNYSHIYTANGTYKAVLTINDSTGSCTATDTVAVIINNITVPCTLSAHYTYTINAGGQVSFTSTSTGTYAGTQYYWNAGDGSPAIKGTNTFSHTYTYVNYYTVLLTIKDTGTAYCSDSIYYSILVNTADSSVCNRNTNFTYTLGPNGHITFSETTLHDSLSYPLNFTWRLGNGTTLDSSRNFNYVYTANGTYNVTLITTSTYPYACTDSITIPVTISNVTVACTLSASFTETNDTTKGLVHFASTSTGTYAGTQYFWTPGDGSPAILGGNILNYAYKSNGTYTASLVIKDTGSAYCIDSVYVNLTISTADSLHASFTSYNNFDTAGGYTYTYTSTSLGTNALTVYAWNPGDSTSADTGINMPSYMHVYKYPGTHTVTLSIWFSKYPIIAHNGGGGSNRDGGIKQYDLSTYKMTVDVGKPTGIANIINTNADLKLYPNPNNGIFRFAISGMEGNQNAELQITNLLGEVVYTTTSHSVNGMIMQDVNLTGVSAGTYFVKVITPYKVYNTKAIINR